PDVRHCLRVRRRRHGAAVPAEQDEPVAEVPADVAVGRGGALPYVAEVAASGGSPSAAVGAAAWGGFPRGELPREVVAVVEAALDFQNAAAQHWAVAARGSRNGGLRRWVVAAAVLDSQTVGSHHWGVDEAALDSRTVGLRSWVVAAVEAVRDSRNGGLRRWVVAAAV